MWPKHPIIYEINTWVWLGELSRAGGRHVTLASIPPDVWDAIAGWGMDAVWFMGVWERSPTGIAISNANAKLVEEFRRALPDYRPEDNVGSPYCIRRYMVDTHLGGAEGLAIARNELARRGIKLLLDFVPNHVAPDHPWATDHPEYFIQGDSSDLLDDPSSFLKVGDAVFACGRDPYFPAWADVLQLNAFEPALRQAVVQTLSDLAAQCDGVRCDMAMLVMNDIFERTWADRAGKRPETDYWTAVIPQIKKLHPGFLFVAEAYWDLERELQQQGFDYCYDKCLYDHLERDSAEHVFAHLQAELAYQEKLVRFIENHDEPRGASAFSPEKERAAAVTMTTVPGAKLFHEGQFEGRTTRLPVFLARRPDEPIDRSLETFYRVLLGVASSEALRNGRWELCERSGWPDNGGYHHLVAWCWHTPTDRAVIVVNLSDAPAQGRIRLPWTDLENNTWQMTDYFTGEQYERSGSDLSAEGLYVDLRPWAYHLMSQWRAVNT